MTKDIIERIEVIISRHTPFENFEIVENCAKEIASLVASTQEERDRSWGERIEGMKKLAKMQIPDNSGKLSEALDKRDISYIVWHYQNTLTDTYNKALDDLLSDTKTNEK